jgi:hypothetical protein
VKIETKTLTNWSAYKISFQTGKSGEYRWAIRDHNDRWTLKHGSPVYILSNPTASGISQERFQELERRITEYKGKPIKVQYVKKYGRRFIEDISL